MDSESRALERALEASPDDVNLQRQLVLRLERTGDRLGFLLALYRGRVEGPLDGDDPILIVGETGTAREALARAVHERSPRAAWPFVVFDGTGLSPYLHELNVYGYARGTFGVSDTGHVGVLERAHGGTLVIDSTILASPAGIAFMRALAERTVQRRGEATPRQVNVRLLVTWALAQGTMPPAELPVIFGTRVTLPPLRERKADLPIFIERHGLRFTDEARAALEAHSWPGNDDELEAELSRLAPSHHRDPVAKKSLSARLRPVPDLGGIHRIGPAADDGGRA